MERRREIAVKISDIFKALSDENRLNILRKVAETEICGCQLTELFSLSQPTISHHLKVLITAGLVNVDRRGKWSYYTVNREKISEVTQLFNEIFNAESDSLVMKKIDCDD